MKEKLLSVLKYLFFLILGGGILYLVLRGKDLNKMLEDLRSAEYKYLLASMIFGYAAYVFRALRWLLLLKTMNYNTNVSHATHAVAAGYFANIIFPRAGEIVRCTSLYKVTGIPVNKLFGTVLLERAIDLVMLFACIAVGFVMKYNELSSFVSEVGGGTDLADLSSTKLLLAICFFIVIGGLYFFREQLKRSRFFKKVVSLGVGVKEGFQTAFFMKQKELFVLYTLLIWLMYLLMTYVCFFSIPETSDLRFIDGLYIMVIGGLGMVVPVQGGLGPYHAAVTLGVVSLGLSETTGITLAVLIHTAQSIMILITGIIAAIVLSFAKRKAMLNEPNKSS